MFLRCLPPPPSNTSNEVASAGSEPHFFEQKKSRKSLRPLHASLIASAVTMTVLAGTAQATDAFEVPPVPTVPTLNTTPATAVEYKYSSGDPIFPNTWYGPAEDSAHDQGNKVTIETAYTGLECAAAGWSIEVGQTVENNHLVIESGANVYYASGGTSQEGRSDGNLLEILGTVRGNIYGGRSTKGSGYGTENNFVVVRSGAVVDSSLIAYGGSTHSGSADNNTILIENGASVTIQNIYGGYGPSANGNQVFVLEEVTTGSIVGGWASPDNQQSNCTTNNNLVYIDRNVIVSGDAWAAYSANVTESANNILIINGGQVTNAAANYGSSPSSGNELHLLGNAVVKGRAAAEYDGWLTNNRRDRGGLVHIQGTASVGSLEGFDKLVIDLVDDNRKKAALTLTNESTNLNQRSPILDLQDVEVVLNAKTMASPDQGAIILANETGTEGKATVLLNEETVFRDAAGIFVDETWSPDPEIVSQNKIDLDTLEIDEDGALVMKLGDQETILAEGRRSLSENSKTLSESLLGTAAFVNQGAEFLADEGMRALVAEAKPGAWSAFGVLQGGTSEYKTGSHVDVDGVMLATGAATRTGDVVLAGLVEAGWASSESHVSGTHADGDHDYYGLGAAASWRPEGGMHIDGALRLGLASTEFDGLYNEGGASYGSDAFYATLQVGIGQTFPINTSMTADVYGRYVLTYLDGDDVTMSDEDATKLHFGNTTTHALRVGFRLAGKLAETTGWHAGLAYEHVFDGDAEGSVEGFALDVPSLSGDTFIGEAGVDIKPSAASPWSTHFAVKGYAGDRAGVTGSATALYTF